jgi:hypothetical protein
MPLTMRSLLPHGSKASPKQDAACSTPCARDGLANRSIHGFSWANQDWRLLLTAAVPVASWRATRQARDAAACQPNDAIVDRKVAADYSNLVSQSMPEFAKLLGVDVRDKRGHDESSAMQFGIRRERRMIAAGSRMRRLINAADSASGGRHEIGKRRRGPWPIQKSGLAAIGTSAYFPEYHWVFSAQACSSHSPMPRQ